MSVSVFLVSSVAVFHKVSPSVSCQICLQEPLMSSSYFQYLSEGFGAFLSELDLKSAGLSDENPANVFLD